MRNAGLSITDSPIVMSSINLVFKSASYVVQVFE